MRKYIKILYLLICLSVTAVIFTCCDSADADTIPAPSGGWSKTDLMSVTYIAGCKLSCPPIYGNFKSKTKINEDLTVEGSGFVKKFVYYDDKILVDLTYHCADKNYAVTDNSPIDGMYMEMEPSIMYSQICINGIRMGNSKESVINALGEPNEWRMNKTVADYKFKDGGYMTLDFEADKLFSISIHGLSK